MQIGLFLVSDYRLPDTKLGLAHHSVSPLIATIERGAARVRIEFSALCGFDGCSCPEKILISTSLMVPETEPSVNRHKLLACF